MFLGELPDMKLDVIAHAEIDNVIEKAVRSIHLDVVYTNHYLDVNLDYQKVFK